MLQEDLGTFQGTSHSGSWDEFKMVLGVVAAKGFLSVPAPNNY